VLRLPTSRKFGQLWGADQLRALDVQRGYQQKLESVVRRVAPEAIVLLRGLLASSPSDRLTADAL
jgi:hypothetical protein